MDEGVKNNASANLDAKGISHQMRTYEVVGEFGELGLADRVEAEIGDFRMSLDPSSLDSEATEQALRSALAALDSAGAEPEKTTAKTS